MLSIFNLLNIRGIYVGSRTMHEQTIQAMASSKIKPVIDRSFAFNDALDAYRYFASQNHVGKVVIEF